MEARHKALLDESVSVTKLAKATDVATRTRLREVTFINGATRALLFHRDRTIALVAQPKAA